MDTPETGWYLSDCVYALEYVSTTSDDKVTYRVTIGGAVNGTVVAQPMPGNNGASTKTGQGRIIVNGASGYLTSGQTVNLNPNQDYTVTLCWEAGAIMTLTGPFVIPGVSGGSPTIKIHTRALVKALRRTVMNNQQFPAEFWVRDSNGKLLDHFTLQPGEQASKEWQVSGGQDIKIQTTYHGVAENLDANGNLQPGDYDSSTFTTITNGSMTTVRSGSTDVPEGPVIDGGTSGLQSQGGVTRTVIAGGPISSTNDQAAAVTEGTYIAGANNIASAVRASGGAIVDAINRLPHTAGGSSTGGTSTGGTTVDMAATNAKLDTANTTLTAIKDAQADYFAREKQASQDAVTAEGQREAKGVIAKAQTEDAVTGARGTPTLGKESMSDTPVSAGTGWVVNWPGVAEINLDPMSSPEVSTLAGFLKKCLAWAIFVIYEWWLWKEFRDVFLFATMGKQARGNTLAGTGGQVTALVAALAITAVLVTIPGLYWALADSGYTYNINANPVADAPNKAAYLFTLFVPTGTLTAVCAQVFVVRKFGLALIGGVHAVIRFIVP